MENISNDLKQGYNEAVKEVAELGITIKPRFTSVEEFEKFLDSGEPLKLKF